jgi:hypothetical protein
MTDPIELERTIRYRDCFLVLTRSNLQWQIAIVIPWPTLRPAIPVVRGWVEVEVIDRAKRKVDEILSN